MPIYIFKYFYLIADRLDDLVPLDGVLGGLGSLQLLDDRAAGTDPDTLFPQEAVLAHRIWGVGFQKWTRYCIVNQLAWHLTGITGSINGFVKFKPRSQAVQNYVRVQYSFCSAPGQDEWALQDQEYAAT